MKEQEPERRQQERDPFWTHDVRLFDAALRYYGDRPQSVHAKIHTSREHYRTSRLDDEVIPLMHRTGERTYVLMKPYIPEPVLTITVGLSPNEQPDGAIGRVLATEQTGVRRREIGQVQAWHYPADRVLVLWEAYLLDRFRDHKLPADPHMHNLWTAAEQWLMGRFPQTRSVVTTAADPLFADDEYHTFLSSLGYQPVGHAAWRKEVAAQP